jgi:cytochrome c oxidase subunit II
MKSGFQGLRARAAGVAAGLTAAFWGVAAIAQEEHRIGRPTNWAIDLQAGVTPLRNDAIWFHNWILMPVITAITLFVLLLLVIVVVRFNKRSNPVPAKWSHNTAIEIAWTVIPVMILMVISLFSFRLLFDYNDMPKPDVTVKATGYQWYWGYEYPDQKIGEFISNIEPKEKAEAAGKPWLLATTAPMVVPVNKVIRVQVTGADVIHAWAVPAFGVITDAVPGRLNETWFKANREGIYYGSCRELCGVDHAFMPIEVHVVSQAAFDAWVAGKAPKPAPAAPAAAEAATPAAAAAPAAPAATPAAAPAAPATK